MLFGYIGTDYKESKPTQFMNGRNEIAKVLRDLSPHDSGENKNEYQLLQGQILDYLTHTVEINKDDWIVYYEYKSDEGSSQSTTSLTLEETDCIK